MFTETNKTCFVVNVNAKNNEVNQFRDSRILKFWSKSSSNWIEIFNFTNFYGFVFVVFFWIKTLTMTWHLLIVPSFKRNIHFYRKRKQAKPSAKDSSSSAKWIRVTTPQLNYYLIMTLVEWINILYLFNKLCPT